MSPHVRPRLCIAAGGNLLFIAALAFASGIVAANFVWRAPLIWLIAFVIAAAGVCALHRRAPSLAFALAVLSLVPLGAFYLQVTDAAQVTPPNLEAFATGEGTVDVTAHVMREGIVRDSPFGGKQESVDVETEQLASGDHRSLGRRRHPADDLHAARRGGRSARAPEPSRRCRCTPTASGCIFPQSCARRETTAIPAHWIWWDIWHRKAFG